MAQTGRVFGARPGRAGGRYASALPDSLWAAAGSTEGQARVHVPRRAGRCSLSPKSSTTSSPKRSAQKLSSGPRLVGRSKLSGFTRETFVEQVKANVLAELDAANAEKSQAVPVNPNLVGAV